MVNGATSWAVSPLVAALALSCSASPGNNADAGSPGTKINVAAGNFDNFCAWSSANATTATDAADGVHGSLGPLRVYWNQSPPHGSQTFPIGTIIVKESEEADPTKRTIFAMAKVGGDYNAGGAANWEWLSLVQNPDCSVVILWSAPVPPAGEMYAGMPVGDCNTCHMQVSDNDYVWDSALQLSNF